MPRYIRERGETAVVNLLLAAGVIELDDFYQLRVFEIGNGRIIECDVSIFTDAHANQINRLFA